MARPSIRSSQKKVTTPALHSVILKTSSPISAIQEYFQTKAKNGTRSALKPSFSKAVIIELQKVLSSSDVNLSVQLVLMCLEEFVLNSESQEPWRILHEEVAQLIYDCLQFFMKAKKKDFSENTKVFNDSINSFTKLCNVISYAVDGNESLANSLLKMTAKDLLLLLISKDLSPEVPSGIINTASIMCEHADRRYTSEILQRHNIMLRAMARRIFTYSVEIQASVYVILSTSVRDKKEAQEKASDWFCKWSSLQDTFVECISKSLSEGCGIFLNKLYELRVEFSISQVNSREKDASNVQVATKTTPAICQNSLKHKQPGLLSHSKDDRRSEQTDSAKAGKLKKAPGSSSAEPAASIAPSKAVAIQSSLNDLSHAKINLKGIQTPFYPDRRKSLSLHNRNKMSKASTLVSQPALDMLPVNTQISKRVASTSSQFPEKPMKAESNAQNPLSDLESEDHDCKVKRWLRESSKVREIEDDDVQILDDPSGHHNSFKDQNSSLQEGKRRFVLKRPASAQPEKTKKMKGDALSVSTAFHTKDSDMVEEAGRPREASKKETVPSRPFTYNNARSTGNAWERKLRELESKTKAAQHYTRDVYHFTDTTRDILNDQIFKKPKAISKKKTQVPLCVKSQKASRCKSKNYANKENLSILGNGNKEVNIHEELKPSRKALVEIQDKFTVKQKKMSINGDMKNGKQKQNSNLIQPNFGMNPPKGPNGTTLTPFDSHRQRDQMKKKIIFSPVLDDSLEASLQSLQENNVVGKQDKAEGIFIISKDYSSKQDTDNGTSAVGGPVPKLAGYETMEGNDKVVKSPLSGFLYSVKRDTCKKPKGNAISHDLSHASIKSPEPARLEKNNEVKMPKSEHKTRSSDTSSYKAKEKAHRKTVDDSGVEITSSDNPSPCSNRAKTIYPSANMNIAANTQKCKMILENYLYRVKNSNKEMSNNNKMLTEEMIEIKGLAEKISSAVGVCQSIANTQGKNLSVQASHLKKCNEYLGPYEDQSFDAKFPATQYTDYKDVKRQLQANQHERIMKALQAVLEKGCQSSSSSDSE